MRLKLYALLLTAAAGVALPALAEDTELAPRQRLEAPPAVPVYCRGDSDKMSRLEGVDFQRFYNAFGRKLGWPGRIDLVSPKQEAEYVVAAFAQLDFEENPSREVRFFLGRYQDGLGLQFADFTEPDRPLMYADGDYLCEYVRGVISAAAPPER